ncbi:MAG: hypothetical protein M1819_004918 [Sarea resinae]|nr:MAG: hypothetical protein M1819_004918 [Sarea resinae]
MAAQEQQQQQQQGGSEDKTEQVELTFGIEFESILAFHEDKLTPNLPAGATLLKDIGGEDRIALCPAGNAYHGQKNRRDYQSWGIQPAPGAFSQRPAGGTGPGTCRGRDGELWPVIWVSREADGVDVRTYADEALAVAQDLLRPVRPGLRIPPPDDKMAVFDDWWVENDTSLQAASRGRLQRELGPLRIRAEDELERWDSAGVEVVSRVFSTRDLDGGDDAGAGTSAASAEISTILATLRGEGQALYKAFVTDLCGMHVHVGLPDGRKYPHVVAQQLALLTLTHEDAVSSLLLARRRTTGSQNELNIASNKAVHMLEAEYDTRTVVVDAATGETCEEERPRLYAPVADLRRRIFEGQGKELPGFCHLMGGGKGYYVNWSYLQRLDLPNTIEFRQHAGTLDPEEVIWWVRFLVRLVRFAFKLANDAETADGVRGWWLGKDWADFNIEELWTAMEFPAAGRDFYRRKIEEYKVESAPEPEWMPVAYFSDDDEMDVEQSQPLASESNNAQPSEQANQQHQHLGGGHNDTSEDSDLGSLDELAGEEQHNDNAINGQDPGSDSDELMSDVQPQSEVEEEQQEEQSEEAEDSDESMEDADESMEDSASDSDGSTIDAAAGPDDPRDPNFDPRNPDIFSFLYRR